MLKVYVTKGFGFGQDSFSTSPMPGAEEYTGDIKVQKQRVEHPSRGVLSILIVNGQPVAENFKKT